jgi:proton glutamate symport protein
MTRRYKVRLSQTQWVLVSMAIGLAVGYLFPDNAGGRFHASDLQILSTLFLRMVESLIAPLIFGTLVVGIAGHGGDIKGMGKLALRTILYFEVVTTLALVVGLVAVNLIRPGRGVLLSGADVDAVAQLARSGSTLTGALERIVPRSVIDAAARNDALQIVFFAVVFAIGLAQVPGRTRKVMLEFCESLCEVMFKYVNVVMMFAPLGIGAAIAGAVGRNGLGVLGNLAALVLTLYAALLGFALLVLLPVALLFKVPLEEFSRAVKEPWLIAFSTASSEAALPTALRNMTSLGVPGHIVSFVLPLGYTFNLDGSTLYLALASVFVAQAAGVTMTLPQQLLMMLTLMLTTKGLAGVPRAGLAILSGTLAQFGLPLQGVAVILGVDAIMDMGRTSINVLGNCLATVVVARWDGSFRSLTLTTPTADPITDRSTRAFARSSRPRPETRSAPRRPSRP